MNVIIIETGEKKVLSIVDSESRIDFTLDFIGNHGALSDGQFAWDEEHDSYVCDQDTYDLWSKIINDHQELEDRIGELEARYGSDRVWEVLDTVGDCDLGDLAAEIKAALDEAFE